ncbi:NUDIX domain-containing protein [Cytobacillus kochii]|uniref:NUDIX domain-containing protein n=1 Tax=Cytobacillus kochii TaxID=859143 RepID=UPI0025A24D0B|nr:NUDIX domain-containing protein [Cytobacillus kochii]MDM5209164.1 NUDIX domain-containing protein [Cytobacillus kochii]
MEIRNASRAIMIEDERLLLVKCMDELGIFYVFPGGGQNHGETLEETVKRECLEETGAIIKVGNLRYIREYIGGNHEFSSQHKNVHQVEFFFTCHLVDQNDAILADDHQVGIEWIPIKSLEALRIYPQELTKYLLDDHSPVYLGDVN